MLCSDTGKTETVHIEGMSIPDAQHIGDALRAVRGYGHGTGEICIPLVNGIFDKLKIAITAYRNKATK